MYVNFFFKKYPLSPKNDDFAYFICKSFIFKMFVLIFFELAI